MNVTMQERIAHTAKTMAKRHSRWITADQTIHELDSWAAGRGQKHLKAAETAGDETKIDRLLVDTARRYVEAEKARASGYSPDDVAYYSAERLADLVPMALDPNWDGLTGESEDSTGGRGGGSAREGGTLLAMVVDVRRVLDRMVVRAGRRLWPADFDPETGAGLDRLVELQELLGGAAPFAPGNRRGTE